MSSSGSFADAVWTDYERTAMEDATRRQKHARRKMRDSECGSSEYWECVEAGIQIEKELTGLHLKGMVRARQGDNDAILKAEWVARGKRVVIEEKEESIRRRQKRYAKRNEVLSWTKAIDTVSQRAAFVQLVVEVVTTTSRAKQAALAGQLKDAYGYQKRKAHQEYVWNVFGNDWISRCYAAAGHIFPLCLGQDTMVYIFGKDARDEINTARNGLWMPAHIKHSFDHHQIVIIPDGASPNKSPREWKTLVLDRSLWNIVAFSKTTYAQLHNRKLSFRTDSRPRARYFYFHFLISMIIRSRGNSGILQHESPAYTTPALSRAWGSEGSYLRENVIRGFIEELGHEIAQRTRFEMLGHSNQGIADDEMQRMNENIQAMNLESEDEDGYEDSDSDED